jgi:tyrosine-protein phosphatase non-receptor type 4
MLDRIRIGGFSGTYRIRNAELARDRKQRTINVSVLFLDDTQHVFQIEVHLFLWIFYGQNYSIFFLSHQKKAKGSELLDQVFQQLELTERYYFGLKFLRSSDVVVSLHTAHYKNKQLYPLIVIGVI